MTNQNPKLTFSYAQADEKSDDLIFNFSTKPAKQVEKEKPGIPLPKEQWDDIAKNYMREISGKELKAGKDYTITYDPDGTGISIKMKAKLIDPDRRIGAESAANQIMADYIRKHPELAPDAPADEAKAAPAPESDDQAKEVIEVKSDDIKPAAKREFVTVIDDGEAPYRDDPNNDKSYFLEIEKDNGERQKIWDNDLKSLIEEQKIVAGERISLEKSMPKKTVIEVPKFNDAGQQAGKQTREVMKSQWQITRDGEQPKPHIATAPAAKTEDDKPATPVLFTAAQQQIKRQQEEHVRRVGETRRAVDRAAEQARQQRNRNLARPTIG